MKNAVTIVTIALIFSSCAGIEAKRRAEARTKTEDRMNEWLGVHVDDLVKSHGIPTSTYKLTDGGQVVEYQEKGMSRSVSSYGVTQTAQSFCETTFNVDANGIITDWRQHGNSCKAF